MLLPACALAGAAPAQPVILHLKDGDQITGFLVSESTNQVVISNAWVKALTVPLSEISKREAGKAPAPPAPAPAQAKKPAAKPAKAAATAAVKQPAKPTATWHGQVTVGLDTIFGTRDQQDYYGHATLTYLRPYKAHPNKFFRNTSQVDGEYQRTDGQESANHAEGSNKSDFDMWKKYYAYGMGGAGYDEVRKIDFKYQAGTGGGVHVIQQKNFALNGESGLDYEAQYRRDAANLETFYLRLAQDFTWQIHKNLKLTENEQFYPDLEHFGEYHNDFTSTLSYGFWKHLSLNLTVLDEYNTELAPGVEPNQFEFRASLGYTF